MFIGAFSASHCATEAWLTEMVARRRRPFSVLSKGNRCSHAVGKTALWFSKLQSNPPMVADLINECVLDKDNVRRFKSHTPAGVHEQRVASVDADPSQFPEALTLAIRRIGRRSVRLSGREPRLEVRGRAAVCTFLAALAAIALGLHACGRVAGKRVS